MNYTAKIVSSLEKVFCTDALEKFETLTSASTFVGERFSCQLLVHFEDPECVIAPSVWLSFDGELAPYVNVREVCEVPVKLPVFPNRKDENYLSTAPGLYPDLLLPSPFGEEHPLMVGLTKSLWLTVTIPDGLSGEKTLSVSLRDKDGKELLASSLTLDILPVKLPDHEMKITQWFHCDSLATYYGVETFSEAHWRIVEAYARASRAMGNNMILTPIHTPPLDTAVGGERPTVQLVGIVYDGANYSFDFTLLDRWIETMDAIGFRYFEMAHLFTQWGAAHAPKIMVWQDGALVRRFGWETDALGEEYAAFLGEYLTALCAHLDDLGVRERCYFHVSDEPDPQHVPAYTRAKALVKPYIGNSPIMDASWNYDLYRDGVMDIAISPNDMIKPFLDGEVKGLWTYYCCGQCLGVANNLIAMPAYRTRSLAAQFYKYRIAGFLQWGFNFYNTRESIGRINPFLDPSAGDWVPAGDPFIVYPAPDGTPYESLRYCVFAELLSELRLFLLHESYYGREETLGLIEEHLGEVTFDRCATSARGHLALHEALASRIKASL